jgi:hypothetical protein
VCGLRNINTGEASQHPLYINTTLGTGKWGAEAHMGAMAESQVQACVRSVDSELTREIELPWVPIGSADDEHHSKSSTRPDVPVGDARGQRAFSGEEGMSCSREYLCRERTVVPLPSGLAKSESDALLPCMVMLRRSSLRSFGVSSWLRGS